MHSCPLCFARFHVRELPHQSWWKHYRCCPSCGGRITVDRDTRIRQYLFLLVALISLLFTVLLHFEGPAWLMPALLSYLVMAVALYWGTKHVRFVPYEPEQQD